MPKRKCEEAGPVLQAGNKVISLEGYLTKRPKKHLEADSLSQAASHLDTPGAPASNDPEPSSLINAYSTRDGKVVQNEGHTAAKMSIAEMSGDPKFFQARRALPLHHFQGKIRQALQRSDILILVGEAGSGKTTQVPQFLYQEPWCQRRNVKVDTHEGGARAEEIAVGGMIAITQPRRVAATTLAYRVSREMGTPLDHAHGSAKGLVGYSVRFEHRVPRGAKIKFLTEGMLLQELLRDPHLRQYSAVIVDEIHERSTDVDILCGFLKLIATGDLSGRGGAPLKIVAMSATAEVEKIHEFFSVAERDEDSVPCLNSEASVAINAKTTVAVELLKIEGRQFPVDVIHLPTPIPDIQEATLAAIFKIHTEEPLPGDILAFLLGQEDIEAAQRLIQERAAALTTNMPKIKVCPLFGQLSIEAQHDAFRPVKEAFTRKVVLATNIAETSVTVPGVRYVVDGGKAKVKQFRPRLGMETLLAKPISQSSAIQRAGRAGREGPGKCYRMYTSEGFEGLQKNDLPEILRNDVLGAVLAMKARGVEDIFSFPLMDTPNLESVRMALTQLHYLGALGDDFSITDMGKRMAHFPVSVPFARVIFAAAGDDCLLEVIDIISCVTAGDNIFLSLQSEEAREKVDVYRRQLYRREGDLLTYLTTMQQYSAENADRGRWCADRKINIRNMKQALNIRRQLRGLAVKEKLLETAPPPDPHPFTPTPQDKANTILRCFLRGFAFKTAVLVPDLSYMTAHGRHTIAIHPASVLHGKKLEAIMFLDHVFTLKNYAKKVSAIQAGWIAEALEA